MAQYHCPQCGRKVIEDAAQFKCATCEAQDKARMDAAAKVKTYGSKLPATFIRGWEATR